MIFDKIVSDIQDAEKEVLRQVVEMVLKRPAIPEDYSKFTICYRSHLSMNYDLKYQDIYFGWIEKEIGPKIKITFHPRKDLM